MEKDKEKTMEIDFKETITYITNSYQNLLICTK